MENRIISNVIAIIAIIVFLANAVFSFLNSNYNETSAWFCAAIWALVSIKRNND